MIANEHSVDDRDPQTRGFWAPATVPKRVAWLQRAMAIIAVLYFFDCFGEASRWFGPRGWLAADGLASFLTAAELSEQAKWYLSPFWWLDSLMLYRVGLLAGIGLSAWIALGLAPRFAMSVLWLIFVSVANRSMMLSGVAEAMLSQSLFAMAITAFAGVDRWWAGFGMRLLVCQFTVVAAVSAAATVNGDVWWSGFGAIALAEPVGLRAIDWTSSPLTTTWVHDLVTAVLALGMPMGVLALWNERMRIAGFGIIAAWSLIVALIGSQWLESLVFTATAAGFLCIRRNQH